MIKKNVIIFCSLFLFCSPIFAMSRFRSLSHIIKQYKNSKPLYTNFFYNNSKLGDLLGEEKVCKKIVSTEDFYSDIHKSYFLQNKFAELYKHNSEVFMPKHLKDWQEKNEILHAGTNTELVFFLIILYLLFKDWKIVVLGGFS